MTGRHDQESPAVGQLTLAAHNTPAGPRVELGGDLDFETAQEFRDLLPTLVLLPGQRLVLDLGRIEFFDSSGINALLAARGLALAARARLELAAAPEHVLRALDTVGLADVFAPGDPSPDAG